MRSRGRREIGLPAPALDRIASDFPLPFRERVGGRVNVLGRDLPPGGRRPPRPRREPAPDSSRLPPPPPARMDEPSFRQWAAGGRALAELAAAIAGAYFKASPDVLPALAGAQMGEWAHPGERLYKATWKSISLASTFFALS